MLNRSFGVGNVPYLDVDNHGLVNVDASFHIHLAEAKDFQSSVTPQTWSLVQHYVADLKQRSIRIAIFGTTAQGNANANATRSLVRLSHSLGIDMRW